MLTHLEREATSAGDSPRLAWGMLGVELTAEQVQQQLPVRLHPQVALANGDEDRRLRDRVGGEVVQLHLVVLAERTDESPGGDAEHPLVQPCQADDVAARGLRLHLR